MPAPTLRVVVALATVGKSSYAELIRRSNLSWDDVCAVIGSAPSPLLPNWIAEMACAKLLPVFPSRDPDVVLGLADRATAELQRAMSPEDTGSTLGLLRVATGAAASRATERFVGGFGVDAMTDVIKLATSAFERFAGGPFTFGEQVSAGIRFRVLELWTNMVRQVLPVYTYDACAAAEVAGEGCVDAAKRGLAGAAVKLLRQHAAAPQVPTAYESYAVDIFHAATASRHMRQMLHEGGGWEAALALAAAPGGSAVPLGLLLIDASDSERRRVLLANDAALATKLLSADFTAYYRHRQHEVLECATSVMAARDAAVKADRDRYFCQMQEALARAERAEYAVASMRVQVAAALDGVKQVLGSHDSKAPPVVVGI
jgi:hypothetical protein